MDISIEMEKLGINTFTNFAANTSLTNELSSNSRLDEVVATSSNVRSETKPLNTFKDNQNRDSTANTESIPSTSNSATIPSEKPKQKNVTTPKHNSTTPRMVGARIVAEKEKTAAKAPNRRQQLQNGTVKQGRVTKRTGIHKGGPNRRSIDRQLEKRPKGANQGFNQSTIPQGPNIGGPNPGQHGPLMGQPRPLMGRANGPMMNPGGPLMGGPHGTFTGGQTNNTPPMGGPPMAAGFMGPQGPMMDGPMGPMNPQGHMGPGGPMGPMGPCGPMRDNPMMHAQMRAAQHHAAKQQQQRNARGRGARQGGAGQKRGDRKMKGGAKKGGEKNMPNKDVLMNY